MKLPIYSANTGACDEECTCFYDADDYPVEDEYLVKAANMLPEFIEMLEVILDDLGGEYNLPQGTIDEVKLLLAKVRED